MMTLRSLASLLALASVSASFVAGCGCDPGNNSVRAPIDFTPSSVQASRTPALCGIAAPGFTPADNFTLELTSETSTDIKLAFTASASSVNVAVPLLVGAASGNVTTATSNDDAMQFSFTTGSNAAELDAYPLDSVIVTVTSLPSADGQPLSAELHLGFEDGRVLDQVYTAPLQSAFVACSH